MSTEKPERARRSVPPRTGPIRNAATLVRPPHVPEPTPSRGDAPARVGGVERAVENAYKVLDEQLHQGKDAARAYRGAFDRGGSGGGWGAGFDDLTGLPSSMLRLWSEALGLWLDALGPLAPPGLRSAMRGFSQERPWPSSTPAPRAAPRPDPTAAPAAAWTRVTLAVVSNKPVEVSIDLSQEAEIRELVVQDLGAFEGGGNPPITGAKLEPGRDGRLVLRLTVAPDQPPGTYLGMILDRTHAEQRGTLRVSVGA